VNAMAHDPHAAGDGPVVLDIGGSVGAVVLTAPPHLLGREIEALCGSATSGSAPPVHVGVVARPLPGAAGLVPTAVFGELEEGTYALVLRDEPEAASVMVRVAGGSVTAAAWPGGSDVRSGG